MKYPIISTHFVPIIFLIGGLSACGGGDVVSREFNGDWKSTACEEGNNSQSSMQTWKIFGDAKFKNTIKVWDQPNCPSSLAPKKISLKGTFVILHKDVSRGIPVSSVCKNGKAKRSILTLRSLKSGTQTIEAETGQTEDILKNEIKIRNNLNTQNLGNILPKYNLVCNDVSGKLHTGDLSTGNGSTPEKRPKEMDSIKSFTKI